MKCPVCGAECADGATFCEACGVKLPSAPPASTDGVYAPDLAENQQPLSMWQYFLMDLVRRVPLLNLVMFCVWGFSGDANENRRNWSRAQLIWMALGLAFSLIGLVLFIIFGSVAFTTFESVAQRIF